MRYLKPFHTCNNAKKQCVKCIFEGFCEIAQVYRKRCHLYHACAIIMKSVTTVGVNALGVRNM